MRLFAFLLQALAGENEETGKQSASDKDMQALSLPAALIFDMDGVLIDSEALHVRSKRDALAAAGVTVPEERFALYTGRSDKVMIDDLAAEHGLTPEQGERILRHKAEIYSSLEHELQPVPGALDFVRWAARHFRLALATSANHRNRLAHTEALGIGSLFETAVDSARFRNPKPSPEVFQIAINDLGLNPANCWVIEDATNGIVAAKAAGCTAVGITTSFSPAELYASGADLVIERFPELQDTLQTLAMHARGGAPRTWPGFRREIAPVAAHIPRSKRHPAAA